MDGCVCVRARARAYAWAGGWLGCLRRGRRKWGGLGGWAVDWAAGWAGGCLRWGADYMTQDVMDVDVDLDDEVVVG